MITHNYTPFPSLDFESANVRGEDFQVFILRGTFHLDDDGPLKPAREQESLVYADQYFGDPGASSVRMESDLAPFKPNTDVHVIADAHAPAGRPARSGVVWVRVGPMEKRLRVTGPRSWERGRVGLWRLSEPEPCLSVPIRYEHAYGGIWRADDKQDVYEENPVGVGHVRPRSSRLPDRLPAPQLEAVDEPVTTFGRPYRPVGFGPIGRAWQPRLRLAGTYDETWVQGRWPRLPLNFDFAHYNGAHPDLIVPHHLRGDEPIELEGLHPTGTLRSRLPGYHVYLLRRYEDGMILPAPMALDTLVLDVPRRRAYLVWRGQVPLTPPIRLAELRMVVGEEVSRG